MKNKNNNHFQKIKIIFLYRFKNKFFNFSVSVIILHKEILYKNHGKAISLEIQKTISAFFFRIPQNFKNTK